MICDVIRRGDLEAYVFGEAPPEVARRVEAHLFGCNECATEMRILRSERRVFRARQDEPSAPVPSFEALMARIEAEGASVPATPVEEEAPLVGPVSRGASRSLGGSLAGHDRGQRAEQTRGTSGRQALSGEVHGISGRQALSGGVQGISGRQGLSGEVHGTSGRQDLSGEVHGTSGRQDLSGGVHGISGRRAPTGGARGRSGALFAVAALAVAAAIGWLWLGRPESPVDRAGASVTEPEGPEIVAEAVCGSGEDPEDQEKTARIPISEEPTASVDVSFAPRRTEAMARRDDDGSACAPGPHEVCGNSDAPMTPACEDSVEWCAAGRQ